MENCFQFPSAPILSVPDSFPSSPISPADASNLVATFFHSDLAIECLDDLEEGYYVCNKRAHNFDQVPLGPLPHHRLSTSSNHLFLTYTSI